MIFAPSSSMVYPQSNDFILIFDIKLHNHNSIADYSSALGCHRLAHLFHIGEVVNHAQVLNQTTKFVLVENPLSIAHRSFGWRVHLETVIRIVRPRTSKKN